MKFPDGAGRFSAFSFPALAAAFGWDVEEGPAEVEAHYQRPDGSITSSNGP
jgi:hypothetical protein